MITKELLEYVRLEKASGKSDGAIRQNLISGGGWTTSDIEQSFQALSSNTPIPVPKKGYSKALLVSIILVVLSVAGGLWAAYSYGFFNSPKNSFSETALNGKNIGDQSTPSLKISNERAILPPVSQDIKCAGGVPCPNKGAIAVLVSDKVWHVGNTYRVSWTNSLPVSSNNFYYVMLGNGTSSKWTVSGGLSGMWKVSGSENYLDVTLSESLVSFAVSQADRDQRFENIKDTFFFRVSEQDSNGTDFWQDDKDVAKADSNYFSVQDFAGYGTKQYCIDKKFEKCPW
jgi:hypothetical protein